MAEGLAETIVGAAVLAVAGGFIVYAATTADLGIGGAGGYDVVATFRKAEGLSTGGDVRIAGVKIGSIEGMRLDPKTYSADVTLTIDQGVEVPDDSAAKITSASLLGGSYVAIEPGGSDIMLKPGGKITYTQGSVSLMDLVGKFISGSPGTAK